MLSSNLNLFLRNELRPNNIKITIVSTCVTIMPKFWDLKRFCCLIPHRFQINLYVRYLEILSKALSMLLKNIFSTPFIMRLIVCLTIKSTLLHQIPGLIISNTFYYHDRLGSSLMYRVFLHFALFSTT